MPIPQDLVMDSDWKQAELIDHRSGQLWRVTVRVGRGEKVEVIQTGDERGGRNRFDRTIGIGNGSNDHGAIFALTFAALDIIVISLV